MVSWWNRVQSFQKDIFLLIRSAINREKVVLSDDFDWQLAFQTGQEHGILSLLYYGILNAGLEVNKNLLSTLRKQNLNNVLVGTNQQYAYKTLKDEFCAAGVDFLPIKGAVIKHLYPNPEMRRMSDIDILIKTAQYEKIAPVMSRLGYTVTTESDHEFVWTNQVVMFELHKRVIPSYNQDYYNYFGDGWRLAKSTAQPHEYQMSIEDHFIYLFVHFAKHYRDSGIGIIHLTDLYVYLKSYPNMDLNYVKSEFKKLSLDAFFENVMASIDTCFNDAPSTEKTDFIVNRVFHSGNFGTAENHAISTALRVSKKGATAKNAQSKIFLDYLFLPYKDMCKHFPVLIKVPILLPFFWIVRIVRAILFTRGNIKYDFDRVRYSTAEKIDQYEDELKYVGLNFDFIEKDEK